MSTLRAGRPEAAAVIWRWREKSAPAAPERSPNRTRVIGGLQALAGATVAALVHLFWSPTVATVIFTISGIVGLSALLSPGGLYAVIEGLFATLGVFTGRVLTWLILVPVFYLFFLPFGLIMRRGRRDRMKRYFEPQSETYWEPHEAFARGDHTRLY